MISASRRSTSGSRSYLMRIEQANKSLNLALDVELEFKCGNTLTLAFRLLNKGFKYPSVWNTVA